MRRRMLSKKDFQNPEIQRFISDLRQLPAELRRRLCATVMAETMEDYPGKLHSEGCEASVNWLRGGRQNWRSKEKVSRLDHPEMRVSMSGTRMAVDHPYDLNLDKLRDLVEECDKHDLECRIDGRSNHFPGATVTVIRWAKKNAATEKRSK